MTKIILDIPDDVVKIFQSVGSEQGKTTEEYIFEIITNMSSQLKKGMIIPRLETRMDWSKGLVECMEMLQDLHDEIT